MSSDPSRFADEIIPKPLTCEEATLFLDENKSALAFRYIPTKGNDKGKQFLIFFNASLLRLFQRDGLKEEWYELGKKTGCRNGSDRETIKACKTGFSNLQWFLDCGQKVLKLVVF